MGEPITYLFVAEGQDTVAAAFEGIASAAERSATKTESVYRRSARGARETAKVIKNSTVQVMTEEEKAAKKREILAQRTEDKRKGIVRQSVNQIIREMDREAAAAERAEARKTKAAQQARKKLLQDITRTAQDGVRLAVGLAAAGAAAVTALVGKAVYDSAGAQRLANRISINGRSPGGTAVDPTALRREMEATAIAHAGQTAEGVAGGIAAYQEGRGGDRAKALEEARKFSDVFATFASATGKSAEDFGKLGAVLAKKYDIHSVEQMGDALAQVVAHARESGQPLEDAIQHFDKLASSAKRFGMKNVSDLGALTNIASQGVGAGQADRAVEMLLTRLTNEKTARKLKGQGVDVFATDKSGRTNNIADILSNAFAKIGPADNMAEKRAQVQTALGGPKAFAAVEPLFEKYAEAFGHATGSVADKTQAAQQAVVAAFNEAAAASGTYADTQRDAAQAETDTQARLEQAYQRVVAAVGDQLAPKIADLATKLAGSEGAFQLLIVAVGAAADALSALEYALERLKIIDPKTEFEKGQLAKEKSLAYQKQLDAMGGEAGYGKLSPDEQRRYREIYTKKMTQDQKVIDAKWGMSEAQQHQIDAMGRPPPPGPVGNPAAINPATGMPGYATNPAATGQQTPLMLQGLSEAMGELKGAAGDLRGAAEALKRGGGSVYGSPHNTLNGS